MKTIKGILTAIMIFYGVRAAGLFFASPHVVEIEPNAKAVGADDLRGGCAKGSVYNVTGIVTEEHASLAGEPIAEMKTKGSEFTVRLGFPRPAFGIYAGAHVVVQGTCYSSEPGLFAYLRESKLIK